VGCFFGALANLYVGDKLGRKWTIIIGGFGVIAGTALQCGSINYGMMVFSRIFNGVFNGMITSTVPTYQSECVSAKMRGPMLSISGALIGLVGILA
jgi:MFS family permease